MRKNRYPQIVCLPGTLLFGGSLCAPTPKDMFQSSVSTLSSSGEGYQYYLKQYVGLVIVLILPLPFVLSEFFILYKYSGKSLEYQNLCF